MFPAWVSVSLRYCVTVLPYYRVTVLPCYCFTALLCNRITVLLCYCIAILLCFCVAAPYCVFALLHGRYCALLLLRRALPSLSFTEKIPVNGLLSILFCQATRVFSHALSLCNLRKKWARRIYFPRAVRLLGLPRGRTVSTSFPFFNVFGFVSLQGVPEETLGNSQEKL